jgi:hypothetical protein
MDTKGITYVNGNPPNSLITCILLVFMISVVSGCQPRTQEAGQMGQDTEFSEVTVFKSPNCGCCVGYIAELEKSGFEVKTVSTANMGAIKQQYNIPKSMESCHTMIIGGYFVEGHVPIEAVKKLIKEKPQVDGIVLPGMPAGSPGMPGFKSRPWKIYSLEQGEPRLFITN